MISNRVLGSKLCYVNSLLQFKRFRLVLHGYKLGLKRESWPIWFNIQKSILLYVYDYFPHSKYC